MSFNQNFPAPASPVTDKTGRITLPWLRVLQALWNRTGGAIPSLTQFRSLIGSTPQQPFVGASPAKFQATSNGLLAISGGSSVSVTFTRGSTTANMGSLGAVSMRLDDIVTISYSSAPTLTWFPN